LTGDSTFRYLQQFFHVRCKITTAHFRAGYASWFEVKIGIIRSVVQAYLENPFYQLAPTA